MQGAADPPRLLLAPRRVLSRPIFPNGLRDIGTLIERFLPVQPPYGMVVS